MAEAITPTIGRIVHYFASEDAEPSPAIIAHVGKDDILNLTAFDRRGNPMPQTSVPLVQPSGAIPDEGHYATWMPYQVKKDHGSESGEPAAGTETITPPDGPEEAP